MATITSTSCTSTRYPKYVENGNITVFSEHALAGASSGDVVQMAKIPLGASVVDVGFVGAGGSFTGGVFSGAYLIGDGDDPNRYCSSGSYSVGMSMNVPTSVTLLPGYVYTAEDTIDITLSTVTSGTETAVFLMKLTYTMDGSPSGS